MQRESLKDVLSQQYHCQHCGGTFGWDTIGAHELNECPKRPTVTSNDYVPLPDFALDSSTQLFFQPSGLPLAPLGEDEFDRIMQKLTKEHSELDQVLDVDETLQDEAGPNMSKPLSSSNVKTIFQKYRDRKSEEAPLSTPSIQYKARPAQTTRAVPHVTGSACIYCHRSFAEGHIAHRILHQRICKQNPAATLWCVFCSMEFRSTFDLLALEQVAAHEEVCGQNPRNMCQFCGQSFTGPIDADPNILRHQLEMHLTVCKASPHNKATCRFCSRTFETNAYGPADMQAVAHMRNCIQNPRNSCRFCGRQFQAPMDSPPGATAVDKRRQHESSCPERVRRPRAHDASYGADAHGMYVPTHQASYGNEPSPQSAPPHYSRPSQNPQRLAKNHIKEINMSISNLSVSELRRVLRQLQLKWHPDKNTKSELDEKVAILVFQHVQDLWNATFKKR
eukprot:Protomagalhaensia_wolfi_Nauph_80__6094@NODE_864_length_1932_cov_10_260433_g651_i0_p1_GENE_NODE_864_length_1932_cov_10_260433_g651_i0NODE_864_length_1932_cov_10_260433_g651_i0_p1_ORF_typecomplete_len449_score43_72zfC2HC_2/PF13913_6/4_5zfC2HC_2/PF13913_6/14zfC2HC_2/PF13913_6/6_2e02zfC2HC_2/PF13913_6/3_6zfC2HC_2/PF13913_6/2_7zfC2HC_2/PF13913_6/0_57DnaJ/PF00226_31/0_00067zfFCS/PF06467_14/6_1e02zfFCS/PF06467_14/1_4e02zfFCS/PF06467_14/9_2e02zfFCS/PF06467_14/0_067zfFCS/PF06467_14/1_2e02zfBED/PF02892_15